MNEWIQELAAEAARTSQAKAGTRIGYSASVVNQVIKGVYTGDLRRVQAAVEGALMGSLVDCPVIGEMPRNRCIDYQRRASTFAATNPMRVQLHSACPSCDHSKERKK